MRTTDGQPTSPTRKGTPGAYEDLMVFFKSMLHCQSGHMVKVAILPRATLSTERDQLSVGSSIDLEVG